MLNMDFVVTLSHILLAVALGSVFLLIIFNVYYRIRKRFKVKVNCWFCNSWVYVPYENKNCFDCLSCLQYNGFTKDGSYNKIINEQYHQNVNETFSVYNKGKINLSNSNGLCARCNEFQSLKVQQLANFVPRNEKNYDKEVAEFTKELDNLYKLCLRCERAVTAKIQNQNKWLLGLKFLRMRTSNGLKMFNQQIFKTETSTPIRKSFLVTTFNIIIILLTCFILICIFANIDNFTRHYFDVFILNKILPLTTYLKEHFKNFTVGNINISEIFTDFYTNIAQNLHNIHKYVSVIFGVDTNNFSHNMTNLTAVSIPLNYKFPIPTYKTVDLTFLSMIGLLLQLFISFLKYEQRHSLIKLLSWSILIFITYGKISNFAPKFYITIIQIATAISIIYFTMFYKTNTAKIKSDYKKKKHSFKRLTNHCDYDSCDNDDLFSEKDKLHSSSSSFSLDSKKDNDILSSSSFLRPFVKSVALKHISSKFPYNQSTCNFEQNSYSDITKKIREETSSFGSLNKSIGHTFGSRSSFGELPCYPNTLHNSTSLLNRSFESNASHDSFGSEKSFNSNFVKNLEKDASRWSPTSLNETFKSNSTNTFNLSSCSKSGFLNGLKPFESDLSNNFSKLHVDACRNGFKVNLTVAKATPSVYSFRSISQPKSVLNPPKLLNINNKCWNTSQSSFNNLSRSSSQTSGIASDIFNSYNCSSLPPSRNGSPNNEFDRSSLLSEPAYHMNKFAERSPSSLNGTFCLYN